MDGIKARFFAVKNTQKRLSNTRYLSKEKEREKERKKDGIKARFFAVKNTQKRLITTRYLSRKRKKERKDPFFAMAFSWCKFRVSFSYII